MAVGFMAFDFGMHLIVYWRIGCIAFTGKIIYYLILRDKKWKCKLGLYYRSQD